MSRLIPRSLGGQMALLLGLALFAAQLANFALILNERQKLSLAQNQGPALTRFAGVAADLAQAAPEFSTAMLADASHRGARLALAKESGIADAERDADVEARLGAALADLGQPAAPVRATAAQASGTRAPPSDAQFLRLAVRRTDGRWLTGRMTTPRRDPLLALRLAAATLLLYVLVLGATVWMAMRLARPLRDLTRAADDFGGRTTPAPVPARGPGDLRRAIEAFNAMNLRVLALVDEKDRMLGAIGHDLRTPLASLRIRVESMEPAAERSAAIAKIEEMTALLEDILVFARTGRAREEARPVDVAAIAAQVAAEFRALGNDVVATGMTECILMAQPRLVQRALRNLVDNAVTYGGSARIAVGEAADHVELRVADEGPGIAAKDLEQVFQPFYRLEVSRNRDTGGTGLGLAIARSIAESHGGSLVLEANAPHGVVAILVLPRLS